MKKPLLFLVLALAGGRLAAQDIITKTDASQIEAVVTEIDNDTIAYRDWNDPHGPIHTLSRDEVAFIKYRNGSEELFTAVTRQSRQARPQQKKSYPRYRGEVAFGYGLGIGRLGDYSRVDRICVETVHGVRINKYLFAGAGVGFDYFHAPGKLVFRGGTAETKIANSYNGDRALTAAANIKGYYPLSSKVEIYLSADFGAAIGLDDWVSGSHFYTCAGPGIDLGNPKGSPRIDASVRFQHLGPKLNACLFRFAILF